MGEGTLARHQPLADGARHLPPAMSVVTPGRVQPRAGRASDMVGGPSLHAPSYFEVRHARAWLEACRADATVVLAHGCFDVLHVGHLHHLNQARTMGNI